ncbi:MAG: hypothetical protein ACR2PL_11630, partial [Dehalococcoidia bacterium]
CDAAPLQGCAAGSRFTLGITSGASGPLDEQIIISPPGGLLQVSQLSRQATFLDPSPPAPPSPTPIPTAPPPSPPQFRPVLVGVPLPTATLSPPPETAPSVAGCTLGICTFVLTAPLPPGSRIGASLTGLIGATIAGCGSATGGLTCTSGPSGGNLASCASATACPTGSSLSLRIDSAVAAPATAIVTFLLPDSTSPTFRLPVAVAVSLLQTCPGGAVLPANALCPSLIPAVPPSGVVPLIVPFLSVPDSPQFSPLPSAAPVLLPPTTPAIVPPLCGTTSLSVVALSDSGCPPFQSLQAGCTRVTIASAAGTPLTALAARVIPTDALSAIFRPNSESGRYEAGYFDVAAAPRDITTTKGGTEVYVFCLRRPAEITSS